MGARTMFGLMVRKEGLTRQEFQDHYRHPHGTMGMLITTMRSYVQSHQIDTDKLGDSQRVFEAVAELSFENAEDLCNIRIEHVMSRFHNFDEPKFLDMRKTRLFIGMPEVLIFSPPISDDSEWPEIAWRLDNRPTSIKLLQFFRAGAEDELTRTDNAELGRQLGAYRMVMRHPATPHTMIESRLHRPPDFIGAREIWWPTVTVFNKAVESSPRAWAELTGRPAEEVHSLLARAERFR